MFQLLTLVGGPGQQKEPSKEALPTRMELPAFRGEKHKYTTTALVCKLLEAANLVLYKLPACQLSSEGLSQA